jgi:hypothetical protein
MVRASVKVGSAKLVVICVGLLGFALIADFLWASSSSSPSSTFSFSNFKTTTIIVPPKEKKKKDNNNSVRLLADAYADLPGPQLHWEKMATSPVPRLDGAAIQIRNRLFVFAGYGTIDIVCITLFSMLFIQKGVFLIYIYIYTSS